MFDRFIRSRRSTSPNIATRILGAIVLVIGIGGRAMAADSPEPASEVPELDVVSQKQTALDSEAISISTTPDAEPSLGKTSIVIGLGAEAAPVYDGAKKTKVSPLPYVDIHGLFNDRVYISDIRGIGVNILNLGGFRAGASLNYVSGRTSKDSDRLRGLPDIGGAAAVAGFMTYSYKPFALELKVQRELGSLPATEATLGASVAMAPTPRWHLSLGTQLTWADKKFDQKFFGITPTEAAQANALGNPLSAYSPGSGLTKVSVTATSVYALTEHWGLATRLSLSDLIGKPAKDSPLTERAFGTSVVIGPIYKF
jgi:outer membrane scaffolding protein for murein synthesis (MipA/OmpV family)